jgi:transposase
LIEATMHALKHPAYAERYQRTKRRLGKQRGAKVAQVEIARRLAQAIWHMLTRNEEFAPRGAAFRLAAHRACASGFPRATWRGSCSTP